MNVPAQHHIQTLEWMQARDTLQWHRHGFTECGLDLGHIQLMRQAVLSFFLDFDAR